MSETLRLTRSLDKRRSAKNKRIFTLLNSVARMFASSCEIHRTPSVGEAIKLRELCNSGPPAE